jgi:GT2 family glycosyltransferase
MTQDMSTIASTMSHSPRVSVIIPTYNCADYLTQALESIFLQSYEAYEILVIDDGSTDHTSRVLKPYASHIQYHYQSNAGPSAARNYGLTLAKGEFVAFLDGDDVFLPNKLTDQVAILDRNAILGYVHSGWDLVDVADQILSTKTPWIQAPQLNLTTWLLFHPMFLGAVLFRRHWLERVGGFNTELPQAEDVDLFLRLAQQNCPAEWLPKVTVSYRQRLSSLTCQTLVRVHCVNKVFRDFFAQNNLPQGIQELEPRVRFQVLMWCAKQLFVHNHQAEMIPYLKESLAFSPSSRLQAMKRWIATLLPDSNEPELSMKKLRSYWPVFKDALEVDETRWANLERQLDWLLATESQLSKVRSSNPH